MMRAWPPASAAALLFILGFFVAPAKQAGPPPPPALEDPDHLVTRAEAAIDQDRIEEALELAGTAVERWPDQASAHAAMGDALYRRGDFEEAESRYRRAVALDPNAAAGHFGVGRVLRTLGRYGEAAESFSRAAALSPFTPKYLRVLANHLARREDSIAMLKRYLEIVKDRPGVEPESTVRNVEAWLALLVSMGDRPLQELTKKSPCTVPMQVFRGQACIKMKVAGLANQRFVFDTGATGLTISHRIAAKAKLAPIRPFTLSGTGAARTETGDLVVVPDIALGDGIAIRNVPATVRDPTGTEEGLVGPSFFSAFDITVDLKARRLTFSAPDGEAAAGTGRVERFRNIGGEIVITARVNGEPLNAMVDTGSAATIVGATTLRRAAGLQAVPARWGTSQDPGPTVGIGGALADRKVIIEGTLSFAGRDYPAGGLPSGDLTGFSHALESEVYVILGAPHLDDAPFTIDYRDMTVTFGSRSPASSGARPQR
jgi:predicted aspartyl protease